MGSPLVVPGVLAAGCGVNGPGGDPAWTAVESGLDAGREEVDDNDVGLIFDAGSRQSRAS